MININFGPIIFAFGAICAIAGWGVIELITYLLSFISVSIG